MNLLYDKALYAVCCRLGMAAICCSSPAISDFLQDVGQAFGIESLQVGIAGFRVSLSGNLYPDYGLYNPDYRFEMPHGSSVNFICIFVAIPIFAFMDKIIKLENVDRYNGLYGLETLHPLVSIVDLTKATRTVNHVRMDYGVYALFLKETKSCDIKYGRKYYDYQEGTIVCFAPGQTASVDMVKDEVAPRVYGILFHPDLIRGTSLGKSIKNYTFFSYAVSEALHLSDQEKETVMDCLRKISIELERPIDKHSKSLITMNIELLLNYCMRFYERQFITRADANRDAITRFEQLLDDYFQSPKPREDGLPTVKYFADRICLSPNYFGDMIKKETGKSPQEHIQEKIIEQAKGHIAETDETIGQIAYILGFQYPQHLCRLFKKRVGCTPNEYRLQQAQNSY